MQLTVATEDYDSDTATQTVWNRLSEALGDRDGVAFYSHPILNEPGRAPPDIAFLAEGLEPVVVRVVDASIEDLQEFTAEKVLAGDKSTVSPVVELDDFIEALAYKFNRHRLVRRTFKPVPVVALPHVREDEFRKKFGSVLDHLTVIWSNLDVAAILKPVRDPPVGELWRLSKSIFQTATPIKGEYEITQEKQKKLGAAIRGLRHRVALLDQRQLNVAVAIPPGPQRIRGLAGTGKTVLLAMRTAFIHMRNPRATILFTFHTRSLYQLVRDQIGRFFRDHVGTDPDWNKLHVRHAWGARDEPGVYSEWCARSGTSPMDFHTARTVDAAWPLRGLAKRVLASAAGIAPLYDYVLVDEAQDLPPEFMQLLLKLSKPPHRVYFAQDSMQNLGTVKVSTSEELFGFDENGKPVVNLDAKYASGMEADFILDTAYRCDVNTLMLAHGLGLGLHRKGGPVQMLMKPELWRAIGYDVEDDRFRVGEKVRICRSMTTTPLSLRDLYDGDQEGIVVDASPDPESEVQWIAEQIATLVKDEDVDPADIMVVSLRYLKIRSFAASLQSKLKQSEIPASQAGAIEGASNFRIPGTVTITTPFRAKGNEAPIVFMAQMETLNSFGEEKQIRNLVFTAISRSMGWVRLSGSGVQSGPALKEVAQLRKSLPCFEFVFPSPEQVHQVDVEMTRKKQKRERAKAAARELSAVEDDALAALSSDQIRKLMEKLKRASREHQ